MNINKINFFLIFAILIISFEFLSLMAFIFSSIMVDAGSALKLVDYKFFILELAFFGFVSYYAVKKKK